jgi:hypothetical protein
MSILDGTFMIIREVDVPRNCDYLNAKRVNGLYVELRMRPLGFLTIGSGSLNFIGVEDPRDLHWLN